MKHFLPIAATLVGLSSVAAQAQIGIGTTAPDAKSALDIRASDKGLLIPRLTATQRTGILSPPQGLMVYQTDGSASGGPQTGFWYYAGTGGWVFIEPAAADNLGNHTATQNLNLTDKLLVGGTAAAPGTQGLKVDGAGRVGVGIGAAVALPEQFQVDGGNAKIGLAQWTAAANDRLLKFGDGSFVTLGETGGDDLLQFRAKDFRFNASLTGYTGNVGIGLGAAVAPSEALEVGGNVKITGTAGTEGLIFPDGSKQTTAATSSGAFTLPYSGTASTTGSVFQITNSGAGIGLRGASASGQGVVGRVNGTGAGQGVVGVKGSSVPNVADAGVVGLSDAAYGVYAYSFQNYGVFGTTDGGSTGLSTGLAGVRGRATTDGIGVLAESASGTAVQATSGTGIAVRGETSNTSAAVFGNNTSTAGGAAGVLGFSNGGYGVRGVNLGTGLGVSGQASSGFGVSGVSGSESGVYGLSGAGNVGGVAGVRGVNNSGGVGVLGTTNTGYGVRGEATGSNGYATIGVASGANGIGVYGSATSSASAVYGVASGTGRAGYFNQNGSSSTANAVEVQNSSLGRTAYLNQSNTSSTANALEVQNNSLGSTAYFNQTNASNADNAVEIHTAANSNTSTALRVVHPLTSQYDYTAGIIITNPTGSNLTGLSSNAVSLIGPNYQAIQMYNEGNISVSTNGSQAIFASADGPDATFGTITSLALGGTYAGRYLGNVIVQGSIAKSGGSFKIDHPLDPENKYLYHSFVESPDMMNVYNGNITLDATGEATVQLPDWFEALNRDFRYQLTPIGAAFTPYVKEKVAGNKFRIAGQPGAEVSWQITGIRHDKYADAHRIPVEEAKPANEQGRYLTPDAYGLPLSRGIGFREALERAQATKTAGKAPSAAAH